MSAPLGSKLRDSCHACAASKVKCQKEKPVCSRCLRRGTSCQYFATKRPGRKNGSVDRTNDQRTNPTTVWPDIDWSTTSSSSFTPFPSPALETPIDGSNIFSSFIPPADFHRTSFFSSLNHHLDDYFASLTSYTLPENSEIPNQPGSTRGNASHASSRDPSISGPHIHIPRDTTATFQYREPDSESTDNATSHSIHSSSIVRPRSTGDTQHHDKASLPGLELPCGCLTTALGFMGLAFPGTDATLFMVANESDFGKYCGQQAPAIRPIIERNKEIIETMANMLKCTCAKDSHLLVIMSLAVSKVLSSYAAAARVTRETKSSDHQNNTQVGTPPYPPLPSHIDSELVLQQPLSYNTDNEDAGPIAAQRILGELYRVQRFITQLSTKAQLCRMEVRSGTSESFLDEETGFPFSTIVLDQLEEGLRKRLSALSIEIIDMLRRDWK